MSSEAFSFANSDPGFPEGFFDVLPQIDNRFREAVADQHINPSYRHFSYDRNPAIDHPLAVFVLSEGQLQSRKGGESFELAIPVAEHDIDDPVSILAVVQKFVLTHREKLPDGDYIEKTAVVTPQNYDGLLKGDAAVVIDFPTKLLTYQVIADDKPLL
ncbi:hypothetical protein BH09PAT4_BH09PAT4_07580 [soil metagenome]